MIAFSYICKHFFYVRLWQEMREKQDVKNLSQNGEYKLRYGIRLLGFPPSVSMLIRVSSLPLPSVDTGRWGQSSTVDPSAFHRAA